MGPHCTRKAFGPQVCKARFRLWKHPLQTFALTLFSAKNGPEKVWNWARQVRIFLDAPGEGSEKAEAANKKRKNSSLARFIRWRKVHQEGSSIGTKSSVLVSLFWLLRRVPIFFEEGPCSLVHRSLLVLHLVQRHCSHMGPHGDLFQYLGPH